MNFQSCIFIFVLVIAIPSLAFAQTTVYPEADTFARGGTYSRYTFGSATTMNVRYGGTNQDYHLATYVRFPLRQMSASTIATAKVTFYIKTALRQTFPFVIHGVANNTWEEMKLNWLNRPAPGSVIATPTAFLRQTTIVVDITQYVKQVLQQGRTKMTLSLSKSSGNTTDQLALWSREGGATSPRLSITLIQPSGNPTLFSWIDQSTQRPYRMELRVPACTSRSAPIQLSFYAGEPLSYVTFMYQFSGKCDVAHCDCSEPVQGIRSPDGMLFTANVTFPSSTETALSVLALYKADAWVARQQYPEDSLPHKFMTANIGCGTGPVGPCDPAICWVALGVRGCY